MDSNGGGSSRLNGTQDSDDGGTNDTPSTIIEIASSEGDVILVVGPERKRFLVCAAILNVFHYFRTLLGSHLGSHGTPKQIEMPEDDTAAVMIICVMHGRDDMIADKLSPKDILDVAIAAHKFGCVSLFQDSSTGWIIGDFSVRGTSLKALAYLMLAAYLFDDALAFGQVTRWLLIRHRGSYSALACIPRFVELLPNAWPVICLLTESRNEVVYGMRNIGCKGLGDSIVFIQSGCRCLWHERLIYFQAIKLSDMHYCRDGEYSILDCVNLLGSTGGRELPLPDAWCPGHHKEPDFIKFRKLRAHPMLPCTGLCLDCANTGFNVTKETCRAEHRLRM